MTSDTLSRFDRAFDGCAYEPLDKFRNDANPQPNAYTQESTSTHRGRIEYLTRSRPQRCIHRLFAAQEDRCRGAINTGASFLSCRNDAPIAFVQPHTLRNQNGAY